MPRTLALIPIDLHRSRLGLPSLAAHKLAGKSVLQRVVERVASIESIQKIILVHPAGQDPRKLLDNELASRVATFADASNLTDSYQPMRTAARKWSLHAWRGGLGGMTCYDELLPPAPLLAALKEHKGEAALLVGGDWPLVDPHWCRKVIELHAEFPDAMQMTFTQAPPGLAGVCVGAAVLEQLAATPSSTFGQVLSYVPSRPQADPIGRDVCVQIPGPVRSCVKRFIYDTPRSTALIDAIATQLGSSFDSADASKFVEAVSTLESTGAVCGFAPPALPQQTTLELTPQRLVSGPVVPQHYVLLNRPPISLDAALKVVRQLGAAGDVALTLGGLGDPLLHEHWDKIVLAAHEAGVLGICIETDLLVPRRTLERLMELPIDVISMRLNADRAAEYAKLMGVDRFAEAIGAVQFIFEQRNMAPGNGRNQLVPWMVPRMVKTNETLEDMEGFFDKWVHYLGHAVIEPSTSGCGLMPELSPVLMEPPRRRACRQVSGRMTVLADGKVARCDQDWLGRAPAGDTATSELAEIWQSMAPVRGAHAEGRWGELELCTGCKEWHRP